MIICEHVFTFSTLFWADFETFESTMNDNVIFEVPKNSSKEVHTFLRPTSYLHQVRGKNVQAYG